MVIKYFIISKTGCNIMIQSDDMNVRTPYLGPAATYSGHAATYVGPAATYLGPAATYLGPVATYLVV